MSIRLILLLFAAGLMAAEHPMLNTFHRDHRDTLKLHFVTSYQNKAYKGEDLAIAYLRENAERYNIPADLHNLRLVRVKNSLYGRHYHFQQVLNGIDVDTAEIIISISTDTDNVYMVYNNTYPVLGEAPDMPFTVTREDAYDFAWEALRVHDDLLSEPNNKLVYVPEGEGFKLVYKVLLNVAGPHGSWSVWVDAVTGKITKSYEESITRNEPVKLEKYQGPLLDRKEAFQRFAQLQREAAKQPGFLRKADGMGRVFDPDPRTTLMEENIADGSPAETFTDAYFDRPLLDITNNGGTYTLVGPWVQIIDYDPPTNAPSTTNNGIWTAERGDNAFNDAMTYYHLDKSQRYMQSLGFMGETGIQFVSIEADSDGFSGDDNSSYSPATNRLRFGHGCVDDNEDADVILHEYGHAINHDINSNFSGGDTGAMGEGFGDYWAGSYSYSTPNGPDFHPEWVFSWDGHNACWNGRLLNVTDAQYNPAASYGAHATVGGVLGDELWSSPNFAAMLDIVAGGGSREDADQIILQAQFGLGGGLTMRDSASATVATAGALFPGDIHQGIFSSRFQDQNMLPPAIESGVLEITGGMGANDVIDPGETIQFTIPVRNVSSTEVTNVSGEVSSNDADINVVTANSNYPNLAAAATQANQTSFSIRVLPSQPCGESFSFTLAITYTHNGQQQMRNFEFTLPTGTALGSSQSVAPALAIPDDDATGIKSTLTISGTGATVTENFNVDIDITHTYRGDLVVTLESPSGTAVLLQDRSGGTADDLVGNFPGTLTVAGNLSEFFGEDIDGDWVLTVSDRAGSDVGTLNSWGINDITGYECNQSVCSGSDLAVNVTNKYLTCPSQPVMLNAAASGGAGNYQYEWTLSQLLDDATSPTPTATVSGAQNLFQVTVTDGEGCSAVGFVQVYVHESLADLLPSWRGPIAGATDANSDGKQDILDLLLYPSDCNE